MEEFHSTQVLDDEIKKDALKKATKIVASAKTEAKRIADQVSVRLESAKKERISKNEGALSKFKENQQAALPLEKERFLISFMQDAVEKSTNEWLDSLDEKKKIALVLHNLSRCKEALGKEKSVVYFYGFSESAVKAALGKEIAVQGYKKTDFNKLVRENGCGIKKKCGIIIESADERVRCTLTLPSVISQLQDKYRQELCDALFKGAQN